MMQSIKSFLILEKKINDSILAAVRRENKEEALFSQVYSKLKDIQHV